MLFSFEGVFSPFASTPGAHELIEPNGHPGRLGAGAPHRATRGLPALWQRRHVGVGVDVVGVEHVEGSFASWAGAVQAEEGSPGGWRNALGEELLRCGGLATRDGQVQ